MGSDDPAAVNACMTLWRPPAATRHSWPAMPPWATPWPLAFPLPSLAPWATRSAPAAPLPSTIHIDPVGARRPHGLRRLPDAR